MRNFFIWTTKTEQADCADAQADLSLHLGAYIRRYVSGVVGYGKGVMYLTSPGFQLILACSWARLAILVGGKGGGECFYFSFFPVPLFHHLYYLVYLFFSFFGRRHKMTHKG